MYRIDSLAETDQLAQTIGKVARAGDSLVLTGDLGTGKTTLTKAIAKSLGITQIIKSPTYTIIREYTEGRLPLYHMDVYRVGKAGADLGLDEYFEGDGLCVIEWGNLLGDALPMDYLELFLTRLKGSDEKRQIAFHAHGPKGADFEKRILERWPDHG